MIRLIRKKHGYKLSHILTFIVLFSMFIMLIVTTITGYHAIKNSLTAQILFSNKMQAKEMGRTVQSLLLSMKENMNIAAQFFSYNQYSEEELQRQLDFFRGTTYLFNSAAVVDSRGTVVSASPGGLGMKGCELYSTASRQALELQKPLISEPFVSITKQYTVLVSHPLTDANGKYKGYIGGAVYLQQANIFQKILGEQGRDGNDGSYFFVVDASGRLMFHADRTRIAEDVSANAVVRNLMNGESGSLSVVNSQGKRYLAGYVPIPETGWGIVYQTPQQNVTSATMKLTEKMSLYAAPFLIVLIVLSLWVASKLSAPLHRLANAASSLHVNDEALKGIRRHRHWNYEVNRLNKTIAAAFNDMKKKTEQLLQESRTDPLTGLVNRRTMDSITRMWIERDIPFSIIMLDIDYFKAVNDTCGHQVGDQVLQYLARVLQSEKRSSDVACRYGGEEFMLLLPNMAEEAAYLAAERIRVRIEADISPTGRPITLSLGVSSYPHMADSLEALFETADKALYAAKQQGRNRTVVYGDK
ncbi:sensor domain-containing diguanylate cyclase [Paenibacillus beijingensis]|uniref:Diguanylate cyclase n=1 Tax=Paenibacillus beijingensis TaxID=1126833 RepID=A0A0D5NF50_9BACL|nr:sensor domain-containing diguanylate cyclase [Paenibacillus beijingensis]AJY74014.1 diguanylate cyclase [Paenibacillus beijingensis]